MPNLNFNSEQKNSHTQTASSFFQKASSTVKDAKAWITPAVFSMLMTVTNAEETRVTEEEKPGLLIAGVILGGFALACVLGALDSSTKDAGRYDVRPHHF